MAFALDPAALPVLFGGTLMVALAAAVAWLDFGSRVHRAFALWLVLRGGVNVTTAFQGELPETRVWFDIWPWFVIAATPATLWFLLRYRERFAGARPRPWAGPALLAVTGFGMAAYVLDHALFWTPSIFEATLGPLSLYLALLLPAYTAVAWLFATDYARAGPGPRRRSLLLLSLGFALDALFFGVGMLALLAGGIPFFAPGIWAVMSYAGAFGAAVGTFFALARILRAPVAGDATAAADRRLYVGAFAVAGLSAAAVGVAALAGDLGLATRLFFAFDGVWTIAMPLLAAWALVRHQLFDLDVKVRWTISRGTLAAIFVVAFLAVTQVAEQVLSDQYGLILGGVATGVLLFALAPLQRFAERVAAAALPDARPFAELGRDERRGLYLDQARAAWADGALSRDERRLLDVARARLGLSDEEAARLEREAAG